MKRSLEVPGKQDIFSVCRCDMIDRPCGNTGLTR